MAQTVAVVRATLTATGGGTTDFTSSGFGTPSAAIVILCNATSAANPVDTGTISVGFWDGANQCVASCTSTDNLGTTDTLRFCNDAYIAAMQSATSTTLFAYSASAVTDGIRLTLDIDNTSGTRYCTVLLIKGVSAKIVTHTPGATNGSTAASPSIGFAPDAVIASTVGFSGGIASDTAILSFGVARKSDGAHKMLSWWSNDAVGDSEVNQLFSESALSGQLGAGSVVWSAAVTTWGSDTFTTTTTNATGGDVFYALALGGADLSFDIGTLTTATSTGTVDTTTTINPDALLLVTGTTDNAGTVVADAKANGFAIGLASSTSQYSHNAYDEDAAGVSNAGSVASATTVLDLDTSASGSRSDLVTATVAFATEKFTLNYSAFSATARKGWWLAFGAAAATVPTLTNSTFVTGSLTSTGWRPQITAS